MKVYKLTEIRYRLALFCLLIAGIVASGSAQTPAGSVAGGSVAGGSVVGSEVEKRAPGRADYRIGAGDVLSIDVAGEPELRRKVKVMERGTIRIPYVDQDVNVGGLSEAQVAALLNQSFKSILKDPQVTVFIEEYHSQMASIAGAVNQPKQISLTREIRLYDMISLAGGVNERAGNIVQLIHSRPEESLEVIELRDLVRRPELNRVIRDGDFINIPEAGIIYVTGNVNKPGPFPLRDSIKLTQAIAMAGGVAPDSIKKEVRLVRANDAGQSSATEIVVNLLEVEKDPSKDLLLKPYDVVMVPEATRIKQAKTILQAFSSGLANSLGWILLR